MKSLIAIYLSAVIVGVGSLSWISAQIRPMERLTNEMRYLPMSAQIERGEAVLQPQAQVQSTQRDEGTYLSEDLQPALGYEALNWGCSTVFTTEDLSVEQRYVINDGLCELRVREI